MELQIGRLKNCHRRDQDESMAGAQPGDLLDGAAFGHDRIYLLNRITASAPQIDSR
jgi:hypothetical protein